MNVKKSDKIAFGYSIKKLSGKTASPSDYEPFFQKLKKYNIELEYKVSEFDKAGKLHYHGIVYLTKGFYRKRLICADLHLKLSEIWNKKGWEKYIHKDCEFYALEQQAKDLDSPISPQIPILKKRLFK